MKRTAKSDAGRTSGQNGLLLSYQAAAHQLGLTKTEVSAMVGDGLLKEVLVGDKPCITTRSISHMLGYDPFGQTGSNPGSGRYSNLTFEQYAVKLLNQGVKRAKSRTTENYRCGLNMVAGELGERRIAEIDEADLRRAFRRLSERYSKSSLSLSYTITRCVLRIAYEAGDIPNDPTRRWEAPKSSKPRRSEGERIYTAADIAAIFRTSKAYDQELYTMLAVLECTGMRPGELLALEWASFDRDAKTLHVYQAVTREFGAIKSLDKAAKSKSVLSVPKSEYSVRTLRLSDTAVNALVAWRKTLKADKNRSKARSRFIFPGSRGRFRSLSGAEALLQRYRKACRMPNVTFYKFRHTMCTRLALDRQPISVIQHILGDNSPGVVTRVYTHIGADAALKSVDGFFEALNDAHRDAEITL